MEGIMPQGLVVDVEKQISAVEVCLDLAEKEAELIEGDVFPVLRRTEGFDWLINKHFAVSSISGLVYCSR